MRCWVKFFLVLLTDCAPACPPFLLRHNALVGGHPGPRKKTDEQPLLLLVDTTIEGASPSHARQE